MTTREGVEHMTNVIDFSRFGPQKFTDPKPAVFYSCGGCEHYHPINWNGDCRDDANRFTGDDLDEKYGSDGWTETLSPGIDFDEYVEMVEHNHHIKITTPEAFRTRYNDGTPAECDPAFDDECKGAYEDAATA